MKIQFFLTEALEANKIDPEVISDQEVAEPDLCHERFFQVRHFVTRIGLAPRSDLE